MVIRFCCCGKRVLRAGFRIDRPEEVRPTLEKALTIDGPVIIDCHIEKEENVFPMIPSGGTVNDTISA
jgi:acetolactate synthase-1/2/3 large subunit